MQTCFENKKNLYFNILIGDLYIKENKGAIISERSIMLKKKVKFCNTNIHNSVIFDSIF